MSMTSNQVVRRFYDTALSGQIEEMKKLLDPSVRVVEAASLPYGGTFEGIDGLMQVLGTVFEVWKDCKVDIRDIVGDGEWVVGLTVMSGASTATGQSFAMDLAEVFRVRNGRIVEIQPFYFDTKRLHDLHHGAAAGA